MEAKKKAALPLIDVHHHLIYGMDDGAQTGQDMCRMIARAHLDGVQHIIATPHAEPGQQPFDYEKYLRRLGEAQRWIARQGYSVKLHPGCEVFYTDAAVRLLSEKRIPTMAGSDTVLVEFSPAAPYTLLKDAARRLQNAGYQPVFAHVERYRCLGRTAHLRELHDEYHVLMQMNASTILNKLPFLRERWKIRALESGWIDLAATDAHNTTTRPCRMQACYHALHELLGRAQAEKLCWRNAREILIKKRM